MLIETDTSTPAPYRDLCTDCGVSRMKDPSKCGSACQFIKPTYPELEQIVHGRTRAEDNDELYFGPFKRMVQAALIDPLTGAQWTGITTRIAERLLETGAVDAVMTVKPDPDDFWKPVPVLVTEASDLAACRGMRMGYAPTLKLLEEAQTHGFKRLAMIGIPCQVYALRQLEKDLGLERLYVIGTPCSDNTSTENFHLFLEKIAQKNLKGVDPKRITYLEFRADYHVEVRLDDGAVKSIPMLLLPISELPNDFFPLTCKTCVDYTNTLADLTVGYMGGRMKGHGEQWLIVRNDRGEELLELLGNEVRLTEPGSAGDRSKPVQGFYVNTERAAGGLPLRAMPDFVRPLVNWLMPRTGPRGLEFARTRVEMKAIESVLHLRRARPAKIKNMVPWFTQKIFDRIEARAKD